MRRVAYKNWDGAFREMEESLANILRISTFRKELSK